MGSRVLRDGFKVLRYEWGKDVPRSKEAGLFLRVCLR